MAKRNPPRKDPQRRQPARTLATTPALAPGGPRLRDVQKVFHDILAYPETPEGMAPLDTALIVCHGLGYFLVNASFDIPLGLIAGPAGCGKTELLRAIRGYSLVVKRDHITGKGLVSGAATPEGDDPSGILKLNNKILLFPDLSNMLNNADEALQSILGQLGRFYDAEGYDIDSGTTGHKEYKDIRISVLGADTGKFEDSHKALQPIGSRLLIVWMPPPPADYDEQIKLTTRICASEEDRAVWQAILRSTVVELLEDAELRRGTAGNPPVKITLTQRDIISRLGLVVTRLRTMPFNKDVAAAESPNRLAKQLTAACQIRAFLDGRSAIDDADLAFALVVARHTLPRRLYRMARALWLGTTTVDKDTKKEKHTRWVNRTEWADRAFIIDATRSEFREMLRQWRHVGILQTDDHKGCRFEARFHRQLTMSGICNPESPLPGATIHATTEPIPHTESQP